jgi:hypothetical protein
MIDAWMSPGLPIPGFGGYWFGVFDLAGPELLMMFYWVRGEPGRCTVRRGSKVTVVEL